MDSTLPATILDLLARAASRPRLTWYDGDGRVELSGHVVANWTIKTAILLVEELDVEAGTRVVLDLPVHWRAVVWTLAAWRAGAAVVVAPDDRGTLLEQPVAAGDVVVTDRPTAWSGTAGQLVAVALPALARRFDGDLPAGAIDAASAVMTYGDVLGYVPGWEASATALEVVGTDVEVTHHDLAARLARHAAQDTSGSTVTLDAQTRALLPVGEGDLLVLVATCALAWACDASVVVVPAQTEEPRARSIAADERVTTWTLVPHDGR